jgi:thiol-disulfide isomerase/thioredoxin
MKAVLIFLLVLGTYTVNAQDIKFKITGQQDTTVHLVKYFGKKLFYADTAQMVNGVVQFDGSKQKAGILALFLPGQNFLEFVFNKEENIFIEASTPNLMGTARATIDRTAGGENTKVSLENQLFLEYVQYISSKRRIATNKSTQRDGQEKGSEIYVMLTKEIDALNAEIDSYKSSLGEKHWDKAFLSEQDAELAELQAKRDKKGPESKKYKKFDAKMNAVTEETEAYKKKVIDENFDAEKVKVQESKLNTALIQRDGHPEDSEMHKSISEEIDVINEGVLAYQQNIVDNPNNLLISKIVKMSMDVEIPDSPVDADGNEIDSNFRFNYFREHYFDNIDLQDDRLVRTPAFHNKFTNYFSSSMMLQHWDTIILHAFDFCDQLDQKSDMFQYCVSWITSEYEKSKIMGMNKVFVHMGKRYYCTPNAEGESPAHWMPEDNLNTLCDKVSTHYDLVMGAKPPNLILRDTTDVNWVDFYSLDNEYTILYFWDPECGHCKKITPKLQTLYAQKWKERGIDIFAVGKAVGEDFEKWKSFVAENNLEFINAAVTRDLYDSAMVNASYFVPRYTTIESLNYQKTYDIYATPKVWVLDKDKNIIAYSLTVSQLEDLMDRLQKLADLPKIFPAEEEDKEADQMH